MYFSSFWSCHTDWSHLGFPWEGKSIFGARSLFRDQRKRHFLDVRFFEYMIRNIATFLPQAFIRSSLEFDGFWSYCKCTLFFLAQDTAYRFYFTSVVLKCFQLWKRHKDSDPRLFFTKCYYKEVFCSRNWQATKPRAHLNARQSKKYSTTQSSIPVSRQDGQTDYSIVRNAT